MVENINPIVMGFLRGLMGGLVVGAGAAVKELSVGVPLEQAVYAGAVPALAIWAGLLGYGAYDQYRVSAGKVSSADVPVQLAAKVSPLSASEVASEFAADLGSVRVLTVRRETEAPDDPAVAEMHPWSRPD